MKTLRLNALYIRAHVHMHIDQLQSVENILEINDTLNITEYGMIINLDNDNYNNNTQVVIFHLLVAGMEI
jgi:hypothetical protein